MTMIFTTLNIMMLQLFKMEHITLNSMKTKQQPRLTKSGQIIMTKINLRPSKYLTYILISTQELLQLEERDGSQVNLLKEILINIKQVLHIMMVYLPLIILNALLMMKKLKRQTSMSIHGPPLLVHLQQLKFR